MLQVFCCPGSVGSFLDWAAFEKDFYVEFFLLDPAKTAALTLHDREQYGQGKCMLDEYIDSFWALVEQAAYPNGLQLCLTFWDGLHPTLMEHIDSLVEGLLDDKRIASWYKVAWDQWQLMEIQRELHYPHSALCLALATSFHYLIPAHPMPAATPAIPATCPLPPGILMDVDTARQLCTMPLLCWRCQKPGHLAQHCSLGLEVHYPSITEQEELFLRLLAAKDATGALFPDKPKPELTPEEISMYMSPPELEENF
ncbi:hypothetical protein C0989_004620 [Termitomyces sp. Mn162]|nr:hypothetical protein C0989_004620 [Termitomyces sp. Mn162]